MIDQFINFVIRPPRAEYNPDQYLWEPDFTLAGRKYKRHDLELPNRRGHTLQCSHYVPSPFPQDTHLPCVIYCHGNSGCRADANEAAVILLPSNITVFTLDFSGSGLSDGDYVSLGWHEKDDLGIVVSYLRSNKQISCIGLWGRSMGAVTSLLYGADDPSIAGMVLDSAFSNLFDLMMELVDVYKIRLPKFTVAPKTFIPALFGHASEDIFIQPHHSDLIFKSYVGDKNIIKFGGDHNSPRPQFYYDSVSIFFFNVLHPPKVSTPLSSKLEKYYDLGELKVGAGMDESLLYEIVSGLHTGGASSSTAPPCISSAKSVDDFQIASVTNVGSLLDQDICGNLERTVDENPSHVQENSSLQYEECCSYSSSNRESWGRCSSLGCSDDEPFSKEGTVRTDKIHQRTLKALATPLRRIQGKASSKETKKKVAEAADDDTSLNTTKKKKKFEKLEGISQRIRLCILKQVRGHHHPSSSTS
ncbi:hypothetical protein ACHQM5_002603 [Ranunculus cassubicifolius]